MTISIGGGNFEAIAGRRPIPVDGWIGEKAREIEGFEVAGSFPALLWGHGQNIGKNNLKRGVIDAIDRLSDDRGRPVGDPNPRGVLAAVHPQTRQRQ